MDEATAQSLGEKLSRLDLTAGEAALLGVLLGGTPAGDEDEVAGFMQTAFPGDAFDQVVVGNNFEEIKVTYAPIVGQRASSRWIDVLSWSWGESNPG